MSIVKTDHSSVSISITTEFSFRLQWFSIDITEIFIHMQRSTLEETIIRNSAPLR